MGETIDEAKNNALRSAIEQSFGAFISSKTEILNDDIKDEIVSITNGNIHNYKIISQVEIPDGGYAITLEATVSVTQLSTFVESKGIEVEFKGGIFAANIKQQKLNEEAERIAILNLCEVSDKILSKSLDFKISTTEPKFSDEKYMLDINISVTTNSNFDKFIDYFLSNINNISMSKDEIIKYKNLEKNICSFDISNYSQYRDSSMTIYFRNLATAEILTSFLINSNRFLTDFSVINEVGTLSAKSICIVSGRSSKSSNSNCVYAKCNSWRKHKFFRIEDVNTYNGETPYSSDVVYYLNSSFETSGLGPSMAGFPRFRPGSKAEKCSNRYRKCRLPTQKKCRYCDNTGFTLGIDNSSANRKTTYDLGYLNNNWTYWVNTILCNKKIKGSSHIGRLDFTPKDYLHVFRVKYTLDEIQKINEFKIRKSSFVEPDLTLIPEKPTKNSDLLIGIINDPDGYTNFRKEPNSNSEIIRKIYEESNFIILDTTDRWWYIKHDNNTGYIHKSRVKIVSD